MNRAVVVAGLAVFIIPLAGGAVGVFARLMVAGNEAKHVTSYRFLNLFHYRYLTFSSCEFYGSLQFGLLLFGLVARLVST